jgi:thymidylate synthase (FAD)
MKIITNPTIHILSVPTFFDHPSYALPDGGTPSERLITHAGKGCYDSYGRDGRGIPEHIHNLLASRHGSVLEHANVSLFIEGISRGCSHEVVRHRAGFAYSQRSTRYTNEAEASIVLEPYMAELYERKALENFCEGQCQMGMEESAIINSFIMQCEDAFKAYNLQVEWLMEEAPKEKKGTDRRKWARGKARQLLPHALETRLTMTGNLRSWWHFLEARSDRGAEPEMRRLANAVMNTIIGVAPLVFMPLWDNSVVVDNFPEFSSLWRKV